MRARHVAEQRAIFMEREGWLLEWQAATFPLDIGPVPKGDRQGDFIVGKPKRPMSSQ
ncbi:MAG: hypothetical protein M3145_03590 [Pseudomonadota bacterium]|nr:hypothetical protein [Pseudomonadota bacterium]